MRPLSLLLATCFVVAVLQLHNSLAAIPIPSAWPYTNFEIGMTNQPSPGAAELVRVCGAGNCPLRYTYLSGGFTAGWSTWNDPEGQYAVYYIEDSQAYNYTTVFTYYMMLQSGTRAGTEQEDDIAHLQDTSLMNDYFDNWKLLLQKCAETQPTGNPVVIHVEPDLWGYIQQVATTQDDATTVGAAVASSGHSDVSGFANNAAGFAQALLHMRDVYAPNVLLGFHISVWGTYTDIQSQQSDNATTIEVAERIATFYDSLDADFDLLFGEFADRDSADSGGNWFVEPRDFARHLLFMGTVASRTNKRIVLWQIPMGNTKMRSCDNTNNHYQDNRVETLLGETGYPWIVSYEGVGVLALLFGGGQGSSTGVGDGAGDGITNPAPINGNTQSATVSDDDGGYFGIVSQQYYSDGPIELNGDRTQSSASGSQSGGSASNNNSGGSSSSAAALSDNSWLSAFIHH